eukprot:scaffold2482_cov50-Cyclotella_meneghiniana.AAC.2
MDWCIVGLLPVVLTAVAGVIGMHFCQTDDDGKTKRGLRRGVEKKDGHKSTLSSPSSSYSSFVIHILLNVAKLANILPPTHALHSRSGGADIRILTCCGAFFRTSYSNRSPNPGVCDVPPDNTIFEYSVERNSKSDCAMEDSRVSCTGNASEPKREGLNSTSGDVRS